MLQDIEQCTCEKFCIQKLSIEIMTAARTKYLKLNEIEKTKFLIDFLDQNRIVSKLGDPSTFRFHFEGLDVCQNCFCCVLHIDHRKLKKSLFCLLNNLQPVHANSYSKIFLLISI